MRPVALIAVALLGMTCRAQAQVTVQQPVVRSTGVATTVRVPDRGRVLLGGVNSAESFRNNYGPLRTGTSRGYGLSGGSLSASVYIIDLQAMDEAILNSVPDTPGDLSVRRRPQASEPEDVPSDVVPPAQKAANFERLARRAEAANKPGLARLHRQMAARYDSTMAQDKLKQATATAAK